MLVILGSAGSGGGVILSVLVGRLEGGREEGEVDLSRAAAAAAAAPL